MQIDAETIRWLISGLFFVGVSIIAWLLNREIARLDKKLDDHDERIDGNLGLINGIKQDFVSKADLREQLNLQLSPIKENVQEMRNNIRDMGEDIKSLLKRP